MFDHDVLREHFYISRGMKPDGTEYTDSRRMKEDLRQTQWLLEFGEGDHPLRHFAADDDGEHVQRKGGNAQ